MCDVCCFFLLPGLLGLGTEVGLCCTLEFTVSSSLTSYCVLMTGSRLRCCEDQEIVVITQSSSMNVPPSCQHRSLEAGVVRI